MPRLQNVQSVWNDVGKILKQNNFHYNVPCDEQEGNYQGKMSPVKMSFGEKRGGLLCERTPPAVQQTVNRHQTKTIKLQGITFKMEYSLRGSVRAPDMTWHARLFRLETLKSYESRLYLFYLILQQQFSDSSNWENDFLSQQVYRDKRTQNGATQIK